MAKITWTDQALEDIETICDFIAKDSPQYAKIFAQKVYTTVEQLTIFPKSGRIVPEIGDVSVREIIFGNYRIVYRVRKAEVEIVTVHHSSRLFNESEI